MIVCQEDFYLLELTRYIHLNPLRAGLVPDLDALNRYPRSGHSALLGQVKRDWQDTGAIQGYFGRKRKEAVRRYKAFAVGGIGQGWRQELVGDQVILCSASTTPMTQEPTGPAFTALIFSCSCVYPLIFQE